VLTRLSVATVFVCIVILLASACGWGGGHYAASPYVRYQDFVLYQTAPGDPPRIIGYGSMGGSLATIYSTINLFNTSCPGRRPNQVAVHGIANSGFTNLNNTSAGEPVDLSLSGPVRRLPHDEWAVDLPFSGTLVPLTPCAGTETLHIEARPGPDLHHQWSGPLPGKALPRNVTLNLGQVRATDRTVGALWGELRFTYGPCRSFGSFLQPLDPAPPTLSRAFLMEDGSLVTITGVPSSLDPDPPSSLTVALTITGGACDGQTFNATLN
jgi:hypothetical protein